MKITNREKKKLSDMTMTPDQQRATLEALELVVRLVKGLNVSFSCPACEHHHRGYCALWEDDIPESKLAHGCDSWSDPIPF